MPYISKKLLRLTIMDALDEVLKGNTDTRLSKDTQMTIIEAVEKIAETIQNDLQADGKPLASSSSYGKKKVKEPKDGSVARRFAASKIKRRAP